MTQPRPCAHCYGPILRRSDRARYCSPSCKDAVSNILKREKRTQLKPRTLSRTTIDGSPLKPLVVKRLVYLARLDAKVRKGWNEGINTAQIAKNTNRSESSVANWLAAIRDAEHADRLSEAS